MENRRIKNEIRQRQSLARAHNIHDHSVSPLQCAAPNVIVVFLRSASMSRNASEGRDDLKSSPGGHLALDREEADRCEEPEQCAGLDGVALVADLGVALRAREGSGDGLLRNADLADVAAC